MNAVILVVASLLLFIIAYLSYGRYLAKKLEIDPDTKTPAHELNDGVDYVPAKAPVLLGHHFASIAGAGPILGPIIGSAFGWIPVYLWIIVGGIFMGGVHDMASMIASTRHKGVSIGKIIETYLGAKGKRLFMFFAYLTMILIIAVFCRIVATTFVTVPSVATSSILFIIVAIIFGFSIYRTRLPLVPTSIIGIILLFLSIYLGQLYPLGVYKIFLSPESRTVLHQLKNDGTVNDITSPAVAKSVLDKPEYTKIYQEVSEAEAKSQKLWVFVLLIYVMIAAVTPVWILLQPRDYLNSFLLYALLLGGVIGLFFADAHVTMPVFTHFKTDIGYLFPVLFVTVACGAISGFHSLVASGTTAKQLDNEKDAKIIGYGGMLIESLLAILALMAAATMMKDKFQILFSNGDFIAIFSSGVGNFISKIPLIGIQENSAVTFSGLAVSAFALTTLDTCTRLARFTFQEFFDRNDKKKTLLSSNRYIGTVVTVILSGLLIFSGSAGAIWPVFGSANLLLASLSLLAVTVWLANISRPNWFTKIPMFFMYIITLTAIGTLIVQNFEKGNYLLVTVGILLLLVSVRLFLLAAKSLKFK